MSTSSDSANPATPLNPDPSDIPLPGATGDSDNRVPAQGLDHTSPQMLDYGSAGSSINPWLFVPVLYFMQAVPNILVTNTFSAVYKSLGVDNLRIATWTGLAALPWVFKMFWGPLVDLSFTKRQWTIAMQVLICGTIFVTAGVMRSPAFFVLSVIAMFCMATFSATHDIACDGLYLISLSKSRQAAFSGVMAMFSRLGRFFVIGVLLYVAGELNTRIGLQNAWAAALSLGALVYGAGMLWNIFWLPRPAGDVPVAEVAASERWRNIVRTLAVIAAGIAAYYLINGSLQLIAYFIFHHVKPGTVPKNWDLKIDSTVNEFDQQWMKIIICLAIAPLLWFFIRAQVRNTPMGNAFMSYVRQRGFGSIFAFIVFYRFGEAMVFAMSTLFILDTRMAGGMGLTLQQLGVIQGIGQVAGLVLGGLLGGYFISRVGLRRAFWPLVICMHVPNLLYIWAAFTQPADVWLYLIVFVEAFGYGFGFAGYFVFLMQVAQRDKYVTSHYAIGTGLGALFIAFATILAGIVQTVFGYRGVFIAACIFTIPGALTLLIIPLDDEPTRGFRVMESH